jgi:hypothetical protein
MNTMTLASKNGGKPPRKGKMTTFTTMDREEAEKFVPSNIPYDNGKIKMGIYHQPPMYTEQDPDMLLLQSYLIQDPKILNFQYWMNKVYWFALAFVVLVIWLKA